MGLPIGLIHVPCAETRGEERPTKALPFNTANERTLLRAFSTSRLTSRASTNVRTQMCEGLRNLTLLRRRAGIGRLSRHAYKHRPSTLPLIRSIHSSNLPTKHQDNQGLTSNIIFVMAQIIDTSDSFHRRENKNRRIGCIELSEEMNQMLRSEVIINVKRKLEQRGWVNVSDFDQGDQYIFVFELPKSDMIIAPEKPRKDWEEAIGNNRSIYLEAD